MGFILDSSAPKSSEDEEEQLTLCKRVPELNSPDSINEDIIRPLPVHLNRSPRKLTVNSNSAESKPPKPSPYYYSDLLKAKDTANTAATDSKEAKNKCRQSTISEPPSGTQNSILDAGAYRKSSSLDVPERAEELSLDSLHAEQDIVEDTFDESLQSNLTVLDAEENPKRYSFTEDGVHIIRCDSPSSTTSDESDCSECVKRREWHARALALVRKTCNVQPLNPITAAIHRDTEGVTVFGQEDEESESMPPRRLLAPAAVCACVTPALGDDLDDYFKPRSIFYVHSQEAHECNDCQSYNSKNNLSNSASILDAKSLNKSADTLNEDDEDEMSSGRRRQLYETAFDCKIAKSDDDLDEVDRVTNHSVLLQLNNGNNGNAAHKTETRSKSRSRMEGKRLKNSKNQALQVGKVQSTSASSSQHTIAAEINTIGAAAAAAARTNAVDAVGNNINALSQDLENLSLEQQQHQTAVDQQNNSNNSNSQLPLRGYTPSPPSTAPLPLKFPGSKHERFFMNSIRSAPNLPSSNPAHPRLRDLRLPLQTSLRQQHMTTASSLGTSNENSLTDSAYVNPPSNASSHHHHHHNASNSGRNRPRSFVIESGRVLELRKSHSAHQGAGNRHNYSSNESIGTSSGGSMESLRSSTSEGNCSTSSSESRHSSSLSSHSSESGSSSVAFPLRAPVVVHSKLHILSPISDKSSQEPASEVSEQQQQQQQAAKIAQTPKEEQCNNQSNATAQANAAEALRKRRPQNKTLLHLADEIIGSDSGISISLHSRDESKPESLHKFTLPKLNFPSSDKNADMCIMAASSSVGLPQDLRDLPFDMPKLRRRKTLQQVNLKKNCLSISLKILLIDRRFAHLAVPPQWIWEIYPLICPN